VLRRSPVRAQSQTRARPRTAVTAATLDGDVRASFRDFFLASIVATALTQSPALAKTVEIAIDGTSIEQSSCGTAPGVPGSGTYKAKCIALEFKAINPSTDIVYNADVFGQVKDQANDDVLNSGRIGAIKELKPGVNSVRLELTVGASQPLPLKLKSFKGRGTTEKLSMSGNPYDYEDVLAYDSY
jgi:hypothetical protein